jgi:flagellar basal-body rod protein FlgC
MDYFKAIEISAAGMAAQQARVEAATLNLANMNTSAAPGTGGYRPVTAVIYSVPTSFSQALGAGSRHLAIPQAALVPQSGSVPRTVYEPGHPNANADGMVSYPGVNHTQEMMTVMTALRAYEANLAALQATKTLAAKALEIGSQ